MATQVQNRRGTTAEHSTFTGANGELTVDTTKRTLVVHDGATVGGRPLLREDQSNLPTSAPTTGIYNASGSLAISTNGTGRLFVNASGLVGIGTTSPARTLQIQATSASFGINNTGGDSLAIDPPSGGFAQIDVSGANALRFNTNGSERARIDTSGRLGIGTSSPTTLLHVAGSATAANWSFNTTQTAVNTGTGIFAPAGDTIGFAGGGSERARIDSSGRLLVGTSTYSGAGTGFEIEGTGSFGPQIRATAKGSDQLPVYQVFRKSRGASIVQNGDFIFEIKSEGFDGSTFVSSANIRAEIDGTPGTNDMPGRLVFATTADGASSPTERMRISANGNLNVPAVYSFTGPVSANVGVDSDGLLFRATSSIKYKKDVETLADSYADAILNCRPVWYRAKESPSTLPSDWGYWGFIAEEVAEIDPRLVQWKTTEIVQSDDGSLESVACEPTPDGVQYDRFVPHLLNLIKRQQQAIETLEAKVAALESA